MDPHLEDRGITSWTPLTSDPAHVILGPSAFSSWAVLGSTLAHELEVHCRQNLLLVSVRETLGFEGKLAAEREAYQYELDGARRFGLSEVELQRIAETLAALNRRY